MNKLEAQVRSEIQSRMRKDGIQATSLFLGILEENQCRQYLQKNSKSTDKYIDSNMCPSWFTETISVQSFFHNGKEDIKIGSKWFKGKYC